MNPNENNPFSPTGAGGTSGSSTPSPVDFTNPSALNTNTSSLSMSDSLASAQDSLTSAGQAAVAPSSTIGLDELGADKPSAAMDLPNQPLTPAAPVPGSIGSVTSVPANNPEPATDPLVAAASSTPAPAPAPTNNVTASNMPAMGAAPNVGSAPTAEPNAAPATGDKPYYNPFAANTSTPSAMPSAAPTSSTNVPPALQPPTEKFSDRLNAVKNKKQGGSNILMIVAWILAVVGIGCAIFFFIQWQDAETRAKKPEIIYVERDPSEQPESSELSCVKEYAGGIDGVEDMVDYSDDIFAKYENGTLQYIDHRMSLNFVDNTAAEAGRWYLDDQVNTFNSITAGFGVENVTVETEVADNVARQVVTATPDQLVGEMITFFNVPLNEDGTANTDQAALQEYLEAIDFVCAAN